MTQKNETEKKRSLSENLGWFGLGVCIDYFIFKPARKTKPLIYISVGFIAGIIYSMNMSSVAEWLKSLFS